MPMINSLHVQDVTSEEAIRRDPKCDRDITLFGYSRGSNIKPGKKVHIAGVGDSSVRPGQARILCSRGLALQTERLGP